tara:strand:+ start:872 stop:1078 length:207 start_codon:yes stop_codon:yes gene_type:complete
MPRIKLKLDDKKTIVLFQFLYSQNQHLGWARSNSLNPQEVTIYTTYDLINKNKEILKEIKKYVSFSTI